MASEIFVTKKYVDDKTADIVAPVLLGNLNQTSGTLSSEVQTILKNLEHKPYTFYYYDGNTYFYSLCYYYDLETATWRLIFASEDSYSMTKVMNIDVNFGYRIQETIPSNWVNALQSGITADKVSKYDDYEGEIAGKQDALNSTQLNAVNSGITSAKVSTYDGYASQIAGKQTKLTTAQQQAVDSGITSAKVSKYDAYEGEIEGKQDTLTSTQLNAVNSGITASKVSTYDAYGNRIATLEGKEITITDNGDDTFTFTWGE